MCMLEKGKHGHRRMQLEVAVGHGKPSLLTAGLESTDFPIALLLRGCNIDIALSEASRPEDRRRILNSVCGVEPSKLDAADPPESHHQYQQVNSTLHSLFALKFMLDACHGEMQLDDYHDRIAGVNFDHFHMGDNLRAAHEHKGAWALGPMGTGARGLMCSRAHQWP